MIYRELQEKARRGLYDGIMAEYPGFLATYEDTPRVWIYEIAEFDDVCMEAWGEKWGSNRIPWSCFISFDKPTMQIFVPGKFRVSEVDFPHEAGHALQYLKGLFGKLIHLMLEFDASLVGEVLRPYVYKSCELGFLPVLTFGQRSKAYKYNLESYLGNIVINPKIRLGAYKRFSPTKQQVGIEGQKLKELGYKDLSEDVNLFFLDLYDLRAIKPPWINPDWSYWTASFLSAGKLIRSFISPTTLLWAPLDLKKWLTSGWLPIDWGLLFRDIPGKEGTLWVWTYNSRLRKSELLYRSFISVEMDEMYTFSAPGQITKIS